VEVLDPASTQGTRQYSQSRVMGYSLGADRTENISRSSYCCMDTLSTVACVIRGFCTSTALALSKHATVLYLERSGFRKLSVY
jgi:hypothetical protein